MLRELSQLLEELHDGLASIQVRGGVSLTRIDMTLPLELRLVFRNGGCVLLADVARNRDVNAWLASPSKLRLAWGLGDDAGGER